MTPLFVYGSLRPGFRLNTILDGCPHLGTTILHQPHTILVMLDHGHFPAVVNDPTPSGGDVAPPTGDIYLVSDSIIRQLDAIEGVPVYYNRYNGLAKATPDIIARMTAEGVRQRNSKQVDVKYYGMSPTMASLEGAIVIHNGDFNRAKLHNDYGGDHMPFSEYARIALLRSREWLDGPDEDDEPEEMDFEEAEEGGIWRNPNQVFNHDPIRALGQQMRLRIRQADELAEDLARQGAIERELR